MKKIITIISILSFIIFFSLPAVLLSKDKPTPIKEKITVVGTVQCEEETPVSRAYIYLVGHSYLAISDDWGDFIFHDVIPGNYQLEVQYDDEILFSGLETFEVSPEMDLGVLDLSCSTSSSCSAGENGSLRCNVDILESCNGTDWETHQDCSQTGQVCTEQTPDYAVCEQADVECGNGTTEAGEVCDGSDLAGETCQSQGYEEGGILACDLDCSSFDTGGCFGLNSSCLAGENGSLRCNVDILESCNGTDWETHQDCSQTGQVCTEQTPDYAVCE